MSRLREAARLAAALVPLLAVAATPAPPPEPPRRIVVVSFDGAGGLDFVRHREALSPDGFVRAEREGVSAERLQTVTPSLTAVAHASISTGALPQATGIVSNTYWPAGGPLKARVDGFEAEPAVETLWEALARQGHRVAALSWPGVSGASTRSSAPVGLRWAPLRSRGFVWRGPEEGAVLPDAAIALPPEVRSYSPPRLVRIEPPRGRDGAMPRPLLFVVVDTRDDGRREYDGLAALDEDGELEGRLRPGDWLALSEKTDGVARRGRWIKLLRLSPDASRVELYVGGIGQTEAWPDDFQKTLDRRCGFWPGPPDEALLSGPEPDVRSFLEMAARFTEFFTAAYEVAERRGDWDVLLGYQPVLDEVGHSLTPPDPGTAGFDAARAERAEAAMTEAWRIADRAAARYLRFREFGGDVLFLSDHGQRPVRRVVHPAELLRRQGWITTDSLAGRPVVRPDSPADVAVSGGTALVVLNRAGEMPGGVLSPDEGAGVLADVASYLRDLKDETGAPLFETVALRGEAATLGLDHPNVGDLLLLAGKGTALRGGFPKLGAEAPVLLPADVAGQHGYGPDPSLDGIFFHVGRGLEPARLPLVRAVDVAARVAARLGLSPPGAR
ncbi:MAG TPA: alkaline phosphatase family protein [Thermoanaerobaculia bacterium]|nr:alkaline phosphatase family protein [Thermoanaerobaculia bacterium]